MTSHIFRYFLFPSSWGQFLQHFMSSTFQILIDTNSILGVPLDLVLMRPTLFAIGPGWVPAVEELQLSEEPLESEEPSVEENS